MKYLVSAALGFVGILAVTATTASAAVVCNGEGDCCGRRKSMTTAPSGVFMSTVTNGNGRTLTTISIGGATTRAAAMEPGRLDRILVILHSKKPGPLARAFVITIDGDFGTCGQVTAGFDRT